MEVNGKIEETGMDNKQKPKAAGQHWGSWSHATRQSDKGSGPAQCPGNTASLWPMP